MSKSKRQARSATQEDPHATARVRIIVDPDQAQRISSQLETIQSTGAAVAIANAADGTIERIVAVSGPPETVGKVCLQFDCAHVRDMEPFFKRCFLRMKMTR
jgi:hypothetical protein